MFIVDVPSEPPSTPQFVVMAQATTSTPTITLGVCEDVQTPSNPDGPLGGELAPAASVRSYWYHKFNEKLSVIDAKVTIIEGSKYGKINSQWLSKTVGPTFGYIANPGFLGQDKIVFLVEVGGKSVKVETTLMVVKVAGLHGSPCFTGVKRIGSSSETPDLTCSPPAVLTVPGWRAS